MGVIGVLALLIAVLSVECRLSSLQQENRLDILQLVSQYSYTYDILRDPQRYTDLFTADATILYLGQVVAQGRQGILDWITGTFPDNATTRHHHTNPYFMQESATQIKVFTDLIFTLQENDSGSKPLFQNSGSYIRIYNSTADGWRIYRQEYFETSPPQ
eukprot:TRINITY_DN26325_c0_g1_i1.p1 TRINITY_DN26325_c0_g1~~TRINITY_DN26325_c0_g1_i1.p1  ORF type:complete len:159 (+),score=26.54 TRINITY_DN26325_c0_g1_i1:358-834(+)